MITLEDLKIGDVLIHQIKAHNIRTKVLVIHKNDKCFYGFFYMTPKISLIYEVYDEDFNYDYMTCIGHMDIVDKCSICLVNPVCTIVDNGKNCYEEYMQNLRENYGCSI